MAIYVRSTMSSIGISRKKTQKKKAGCLLFSTEDGAFSKILTANCENSAISYDGVKRMLIEKYSGEEYERHLEIKFRNLKHRAHKTIPKLFMNLALQFVIIMAWPNQPDRYESYTFILRGLYS